MEGKERVNRSRAGSSGSNRRGPDDTPLSRQVTARLVDAKVHRGTTPSFSEARSISSRAESAERTPRLNQPLGECRGSSRSPSLNSTESRDDVKRSEKLQKRPPSSISTYGLANPQHIPILSSHMAQENQSEVREHSSRPLLPTVMTSLNVLAQSTQLNLKDEHAALQELESSKSTIALKSRVPSPTRRSPAHPG